MENKPGTSPDSQQYKATDKFSTYDEGARATDVPNESFDSVWTSDKSFVFDSKPKTTAYDVASYILDKLGEMSTMKLHKLLYYCQAWSLVWDEAPLFEEEIEAWANGPVVRQLFASHRGMFSISKISIGNKDSLTDKQKETINSVLDFYGDKTAQWLIDLTHMETPWKEARKGLGATDRCDRVIGLPSMANYYSSL